MAFWPSVWKLCGLASTQLNKDKGPPSLEETNREASQSTLAKQAKLNLANSVIMTDDLRKLAQADRTGVADYKAGLLGHRRVTTKNGDDMGDMIVCDNYRASRPATIMSAIVPLAAIAMLGVIGWKTLPLLLEKEEPSQVEIVDTDTRNQLRFID